MEPGTFGLGAAVFAERAGKILILKRAGGELTGAWYLPGGNVDAGETPQEAAVRELREEAGLIPTGPLRLIGAISMHVNGRETVEIAYSCTCADGEVALSHEHSAARWIDAREYRDRYFGDEQLARVAGDARQRAVVAAVRKNLDDYIAELDHRFEDTQLRVLGLTAEIYVVREGKLLLLKRQGGIGSGMWYIPGGVVEPGEEPVVAAIRETREETGLDITNCEHLRTWNWSAQNNRDAYHVAYIAEEPSGEVVISHEHAGACWLTPDEYTERYLKPEFESVYPEFATWYRGVRQNVELARAWIERRGGVARQR